MLIKNKYGYYELEKKPTEKELQRYYADKYYQESKGSYLASYSKEEIVYINNKIAQKLAVIDEIDKSIGNKEDKSLLDVGCGEGWILKYFYDNEWTVCGLDYSGYGCEVHNHQIKEFLITGDIFKNIEVLIDSEKKYDVIILDNVLEHVLNPMVLLKNLKRLIADDGILIVEVPNDFSEVQKDLLKKGYINEEFWVAIPDHISYFNKDGLLNLAEASGWTSQKVLSDFPIDLCLYNENTNYVRDKNVGRSCHLARVESENLLSKISIDKLNRLFEAYADLGIGRQIIAFFK